MNELLALFGGLLLGGFLALTGLWVAWSWRHRRSTRKAVNAGNITIVGHVHDDSCNDVGEHRVSYRPKSRQQ